MDTFEKCERGGEQIEHWYLSAMGKCTKFSLNNYWPQLKPQQIAPINLIMTNRDFNPPLDCFITYGVFHTHWLPSRAKYLKCIQQWTYYHLPLNIKWAAFPPRQWYSLDLSIIHILLMSITFLNNIIISYSYSQQKKNQMTNAFLISSNFLSSFYSTLCNSFHIRLLLHYKNWKCIF